MPSNEPRPPRRAVVSFHKTSCKQRSVVRSFQRVSRRDDGATAEAQGLCFNIKVCVETLVLTPTFRLLLTLVCVQSL